MDTHELGPNVFGMYRHEVSALLSEEDGIMPFPKQLPFPREIEQDNASGSSAIGASLSEFKRERLVSLLRRCASDFACEIEEEMTYPTHFVHQVRSLLQRKKSVSEISSSSLCNDDLNVILKYESTKVEDLVEKHSQDLADTLLHMEHNLEELLDTVMTTCRPMTTVEKEQLCKSIQELSPTELDTIVQMLGRGQSTAKDSSNEVLVNLEEEDDATLWRVYFYVKSSRG